MPLPERYARKVLDVIKVWNPQGTFGAQTRVWEAQSEARHELSGKPTADQLEQIRAALKLTPQEIDSLVIAEGHETNKLLRKVQSKLPPEIGNFLHKGNASADILDTSLALQIIESLDIVGYDFTDLSESLKALAIKHKATLQIGRSHGQHAIPQTFGRQVIGWYAEVERGIGRIKRAREVIAFGKCSGEVGTNVVIEPELEEKSLAKLGLKPDEAPTQVISRDRHAEVAGLMAVNGATLARIATNIRLLALTGISEVREPFDPDDQQASSSMPHKRNPELSERIVGLNRVVSGAASEELDSVVLWLERDISHSSTERSTFADLFGNLVYITRLSKQVIDGLVVNSDRMLKNINETHGAIYSPRLLNALIDSGKYSRTQAYEMVKKLALQAIDQEVDLKTLAANEPQITRVLKGEELDELFDPSFYLRNIDVAFKRTGVIFSKNKK